MQDQEAGDSFAAALLGDRLATTDIYGLALRCIS
jgi:hypothetical protein